MTEKKIDIVIGTRPEAIKMAPVILEAKSRPEFRTRVVATGQHSDMLIQALDYFSIKTDADLRIMKDRQSLDYITSSVLEGVGRLFDEDKPDAVLVHGDTTTTFAASMAAFYRKIPVGHVEAGLRSWNMQLPFPEEMNRVLTDRIARWHFAPTELARENLIKEGQNPATISVTGNTVVDALFSTIRANEQQKAEQFAALLGDAPFLLVTAHRRESWGKPMENICFALLDILEKHPQYSALIPMHKNPALRETMRAILGDNKTIILCDPLDYPDFVWALDNCALILSDSGGVQEEATALKKPVLILRDVTERPEVLEQGSGVLVGTVRERIMLAADELLSDGAAYRCIQAKCEGNPFGDGRASVRIADILSADMA